MAQIVDLLQNVQQIVRRCPEPTLVHAYRRAARLFCAETRWLRRELSFLTEAEERTYELVQGTGDSLLEIIGVRAVTGASVMSPIQKWSINPQDPTQWRADTPIGMPTSYAYAPPEERITLHKTPDQAYEITVTVQCQPKRDVEELPDDLLMKWERFLDAGALAYLQQIGGQPWSDAQASRRNEVYFRSGINNAKADEQRAYNTGTTMARIRRLF